MKNEPVHGKPIEDYLLIAKALYDAFGDCCTVKPNGKIGSVTIDAEKLLKKVNHELVFIDDRVQEA